MEMKPVNVNAFDAVGEFAAAEIIAFGAAVQRNAAGLIQGARCSGESHILGVADLDSLEKKEPGFYSQHDIVSVITAGRCRVWVTLNATSSADIVAGDYLQLAKVTSGTNSLPVGVFEEAKAGDGSKKGEIRSAVSLARALEDVALEKCEVPDANVAIGATTVKMVANGLISKLSAGDYILLNDVNGNCQINRVKAINSATEIALQLPSTVALVKANNDLIHKLEQCEVILI